MNGALALTVAKVVWHSPFASALLVIGIDGVPEQTAYFTFAIACHAAIDLGQVFTGGPVISQINRLPSYDFAQLQEMLTAMGIPLHGEDTAEQRLAELRQKYEPYVLALAKYLQMSLPGWITEPDNPDDWQTSAWNHDTNAAIQRRSLPGVRRRRR